MPKIVTESGVGIHVERLGPPERPQVLLLEGMGAQLLGWRPGFCRYFVEARFGVVMMDNRDAGLSQHFPDVDYDLADMAADVVGLLDALDLDRVHLVGQSMGGMMAQTVALEHPERVASLGLLYSTPDNDHYRVPLQPQVSGGPPADREEAVTMYLQSRRSLAGDGRYPVDEDDAAKLAAAIYERGYDPADAARQFRAIERSPDRGPRLADITAPTTIMCGSADPLIDPSASELLHRLIPHSRLRVFEGMGHELPRPLWAEIAGELISNAARAGDPAPSGGSRGGESA